MVDEIRVADLADAERPTVDGDGLEPNPLLVAAVTRSRDRGLPRGKPSAESLIPITSVGRLAATAPRGERGDRDDTAVRPTTLLRDSVELMCRERPTTARASLR